MLVSSSTEQSRASNVSCWASRIPLADLLLGLKVPQLRKYLPLDTTRVLLYSEVAITVFREHSGRLYGSLEYCCQMGQLAQEILEQNWHLLGHQVQVSADFLWRALPIKQLIAAIGIKLSKARVIWQAIQTSTKRV